ncbi:hypothetical protein [Oribacterium sp. P6A1]|uniref:hypothetical protein n=1 Tax=Oribacterium sp. P6A1 TaxID=1410612 RepID=UPI0012DD352A|nr:hypothetical protein [Oribacterium sp. P6A1]
MRRLKKRKKMGMWFWKQFFDEKGNLTVLPAGYAQISRVHEGKFNTEIIYLDALDRMAYSSTDISLRSKIHVAT